MENSDNANSKRKPTPLTPTSIPNNKQPNSAHKSIQDYQNQSLCALEKIKTIIWQNSFQASQFVADQIANVIIRKQQEGNICVLGLATGSTPKTVYAELIRKHQEQGLSFKNVVTFNLDEYYPIAKDHVESYNFYMRYHLFDHIDIDPKNINIPDGTVSERELHQHCLNYEDQITALGGIDIQILGIGRDGHIGFNEPGSSIKSITRKVTLEKITRVDAAASFKTLDQVPQNAITMGIQTILQARKILILAFSEGKAQIVHKAIEGSVTSDCPSSFLQQHPNTLFVLDQAASEKLTRQTTPWVIRGIQTPLINFDDDLVKKAVVWLCQTVKQPILRLVEHDYEEHGLLSLIDQKGKGSSERLNLYVFKLFTQVLTGWPAGGKPAENQAIDNLAYYSKKSLSSQKILIFSPHPDDDVICMGATMQKLINQGHEIYVAYQVSGNIAVFDHDAQRFIDFYQELNQQFFKDDTKGQQKMKELYQTLISRNPGDPDNENILKVKGLIRRTQSRVAAITTGVKRENIIHLDLPFYESGAIIKNNPTDKDTQIVKELLERIKPDQVYAAGDLTDPHGTHRVCLQVILKAIDELKVSNPSLLVNTEFLMYRGAWQEWELQNVCLAVPISPEELVVKKNAIFRHESQRQAMFPGSDVREFWQRALDRNRNTAENFKNLGFTSYQGVECFAKLEWLRAHASL